MGSEGEGNPIEGTVEALGVERDGVANQGVAQLVLEPRHRELDRVLGTLRHDLGVGRWRRDRELFHGVYDFVDGGEVLDGVVWGIEEGGEVAGRTGGEGSVPAEDDLLGGFEAVLVGILAVDEVGDAGEAVIEGGEDEEHVFANLLGSVEALQNLLSGGEDAVLSAAAETGGGGGHSYPIN